MNIDGSSNVKGMFRNLAQISFVLLGIWLFTGKPCVLSVQPVVMFVNYYVYLTCFFCV